MLIRMLATEILVEAGFSVIEVGSAVDALAAINERPDHVSVLFTDINMPGPLNGVRLAAQVQKLWPHIAILVTSSQPHALMVDLPPGSDYVEKPYDPDHLVRKIRELTAA